MKLFRIPGKLVFLCPPFCLHGWVGAESGTVSRVKEVRKQSVSQEIPRDSGKSWQVPIPPLAPGHIFVLTTFLAL